VGVSKQAFTMLLSVAISPHPPHGVVAASGELDIFSSLVLVDRLRHAVDCGCTDLILDASGVSFVDGSGLGALCRFHRTFVAGGGRLRVINASARFVRVCQLAGYDQLLPSPPAWARTSGRAQTGCRADSPTGPATDSGVSRRHQSGVSPVSSVLS
jgi:anti-sigma B factor antagonist